MSKQQCLRHLCEDAWVLKAYWQQRQHCFFPFSSAQNLLPTESSNGPHLLTPVYRNSYHWSGFPFFLLRLKVRWNHHSSPLCDWTFIPWRKKKGRIKWSSVHFVTIVAEHNPRHITSSISQWNTKLMHRMRSSFSLHCRPGSQQLEESRAISLSQECRGLTMEAAWARDLTKDRQKRHAQPERHLSQSSESNQAQFSLRYELSSSLLRD